VRDRRDLLEGSEQSGVAAAHDPGLFGQRKERIALHQGFRHSIFVANAID